MFPIRDMARECIVFGLKKGSKKFFLDSSVRKVLRGVHMMCVLREISLPWFSPPQKETAEQHGLAYVILLLPRMQEKAS